MIKAVGKGKYVVTTEDGSKNLSKPMSRRQAELRLKQIEYFKAKEAGKVK